MSCARKQLTRYLAAVLFSLVQTASAGTFTNFTLLRTFSTNDASSEPFAGMIEGSDGVLYGTTYGSSPTDLGGVFKIQKNGSGFQVMHNLTSAEGYNPSAPLIEATNGVLYGTTFVGGPPNGGSIFKINKDGSGFAVIHICSFDTTNGAAPVSPLLQASDGWLYGTTQDGGTNSFGTVFRMDLTGTNFAILHSFSSSTEGDSPQDAVIEGTNGMLYGTTLEGGVAGGGTIFRMNKDGSGFGVIFNFTNAFKTPDGSFPIANLLKVSNGMLYGTTSSGGTNNDGVAFSVDYNGNNFTVLHHFGAVGDGNDPYFPLIQGPDGGLYGTTLYGGGTGASGTAYALNPDGSGYSVQIAFTNGMGAQPNGLFAASDGALYGTCNISGTNNRGTVFKLTSVGVIDNDILNSPTNLGGTSWLISGHGTANRTYSVLATTNITLPASNWTSLGTATADGSGNWQLNDLTNLPIRFYRTSYP